MQWQSDNQPLEFKLGHVAMVDALGWKGIWKHHEAAQIVEMIRAIRAKLPSAFHEAVNQQLSSNAFRTLIARARALLEQQLEQESVDYRAKVLAKFDAEIAQHQPQFLSKPIIRAETRFLSDTLVFATDTPFPLGSGQPRNIVLSIHRRLVAEAIARMLQTCATSPVPLNFRGAIACGEFLLDGYQLLGQAVDDAAERMEMADAAIVWFADEDPADPRVHDTQYWVEHEMPLRSGGKKQVQAVNPFLGCQRDSIERVYNGMLSGFGAAHDQRVATKLRNTIAFLDAARSNRLEQLEAGAN